jgi:hypothetical protein
MTFQGDYYKDEQILRAWYNPSKGEFMIEQIEEKSMLYRRTSEGERKAFIAELERRMSYGKSV